MPSLEVRALDKRKRLVFKHALFRPDPREKSGVGFVWRGQSFPNNCRPDIIPCSICCCTALYRRSFRGPRRLCALGCCRCLPCFVLGCLSFCFNGQSSRAFSDHLLSPWTSKRVSSINIFARSGPNHFPFSSTVCREREPLCCCPCLE